MALDKISSYSLHQSTLGDINKTMVTLAKQQMQISSGNVAQYFSEMPGNVQQYLSLDASIARSTQYLNDNTLIQTRIDATNTSLTSIIDNITNLKSLISSRLTGGTSTDGFQVQLQGVWQNLTGQLNNQVGGQYLFSGAKIDTPAVDTSSFPTTVIEGVPDTSYYRGSHQDITARPQDSTTLTYNIRADEPAFQKVFAALAMASTSDVEKDNAMLQEAYDLAESGLEGIISLQAKNNANKVTMITINQSHTSMKLYWQGVKETIGNTDIVAVSTQVAINEGILQASFQAFSKINSLRLSDYLS